jgi:hypothetical protein
MRQWWTSLKKKFVGWAINFVLKLMVNLSEDAIQDFHWYNLGKSLSDLSKEKLPDDIEKKIPHAIADGAEKMVKGLRA